MKKKTKEEKKFGGTLRQGSGWIVEKRIQGPNFVRKGNDPLGGDKKPHLTSGGGQSRFCKGR